MEFRHIPVMLSEVIENLNIKSDGIYVDCTVGGGGHSFEIAKRLKTGHLYAFDRDEDAIKKSKETLKEFADRVTLIKSNYKNAPQILSEMGVNKIDGFLIDLGVSSYQIDGEEEFARPIAKNIVLEREKRRIETTFELRDIIENSMPKKIVFSRGGASKKVFQALRIYINGELDGLDNLLEQLVDMLNKGGRGTVLTFHSLEDRIVKNVFKMDATDCICPPKTPICICGHKASVKLVSRKPIVATVEEQKQNSRSTCAKLRVVEKI